MPSLLQRQARHASGSRRICCYSSSSSSNSGITHNTAQNSQSTQLHVLHTFVNGRLYFMLSQSVAV
jgi:hypothetical protein